MNGGFSKEYLERLILDRVEERSDLEYKSSGSLGRSDSRKDDITKDISAFANAAGGVLIYGLSEYSAKDLRHLPEKLDPINQGEYSKEWLDQIIGSIKPRIEGLQITPVHVGPSTTDYCYVVEIPQSGTAHQARDWRYYKRRNFEILPMEDYEIRDVMSRRKHPVLKADVMINSQFVAKPRFTVRLQNTSRVIARHFRVVVRMPFKLSGGFILPENAELRTEYGSSYWFFSLGNGGAESPLFPESTIYLKTNFKYVSMISPHLDSNISNIHLSIYADEMEKIELTKDLAKAEREWV